MSFPTGAASPVSVATVHCHGAKNRGDKETFQAQEQWGEWIQLPQLSQPVYTAAQRRQVMIKLTLFYIFSPSAIIDYYISEPCAPHSTPDYF